jgi:hypothetical protein
MKTYSAAPNLIGVISDDYLYYEGVSRPAAFYLVRDEGHLSNESIFELERYFHDVYNLFLRKLTNFAGVASTDEESLKLQALLQELINIKKLIENASGTDIMER